jgi:hypothetical protein
MTLMVGGFLPGLEILGRTVLCGVHDMYALD